MVPEPLWPCPNTKLLILQLPAIFIPGFYVKKVNRKFISKFSKLEKYLDLPLRTPWFSALVTFGPVVSGVLNHQLTNFLDREIHKGLE